MSNRPSIKSRGMISELSYLFAVFLRRVYSCRWRTCDSLAYVDLPLPAGLLC